MNSYAKLNKKKKLNRNIEYWNYLQKKTNSIEFKKKNNTNSNRTGIKINNEFLKHITNFRYLRSIITNNCGEMQTVIVKQAFRECWKTARKMITDLGGEKTLPSLLWNMLLKLHNPERGQSTANAEYLEKCKPFKIPRIDSIFLVKLFHFILKFINYQLFCMTLIKERKTYLINSVIRWKKKSSQGEMIEYITYQILESENQENYLISLQSL